MSNRPKTLAEASVKSWDSVAPSTRVTVVSGDAPYFWYASTPLGGFAVNRYVFAGSFAKLYFPSLSVWLSAKTTQSLLLNSTEARGTPAFDDVITLPEIVPVPP